MFKQSGGNTQLHLRVRQQSEGVVWGPADNLSFDANPSHSMQPLTPREIGVYETLGRVQSQTSSAKRTKVPEQVMLSPLWAWSRHAERSNLDTEAVLERTAALPDFELHPARRSNNNDLVAQLLFSNRNQRSLGLTPGGIQTPAAEGPEPGQRE